MEKLLNGSICCIEKWMVVSTMRFSDIVNTICKSFIILSAILWFGFCEYVRGRVMREARILIFKYMEFPIHLLFAMSSDRFRSMWDVGFRVEGRDFKFSKYMECSSGLLSAMSWFGICKYMRGRVLSSEIFYFSNILVFLIPCSWPFIESVVDKS